MTTSDQVDLHLAAGFYTQVEGGLLCDRPADYKGHAGHDPSANIGRWNVERETLNLVLTERGRPGKICSCNKMKFIIREYSTSSVFKSTYRDHSQTNLKTYGIMHHLSHSLGGGIARGSVIKAMCSLRGRSGRKSKDAHRAVFGVD